IMFEIFTGQLPFEYPSYVETVSAHVSDPPPRPSAIQPMPAELETLILSCLEKERERRPQTVGELRQALQAIAEASSVGDTTPPVAPGRKTPSSRPRAPSTIRPSPFALGGGRWLALAALAAIGIAAAAGFFR